MKSKSLKALVLVAVVAAVLAGISSPLQASAQDMQQAAMKSSDDPNFSVEQTIQSKFAHDLNFADTAVQTTVTDDMVVLSGRTRDEVDHDRALSIAQANAGNRRIVDQVQIQALYPRER
jgi:osmotically-inducible protein OsmY